MDYKRIYDCFISDRLNNPPKDTEYFESHHILPKALGGSDLKSNLIKLIPEDHLFAHLLLAKIHGGVMWNAVHAMATLNKNDLNSKRLFGYRYLFGIARRKSAEYHKQIFSGENGIKSDKKIYKLKNFNGLIASGTRFKLEEITGINRRLVGSLINGDKKSVNGWYFEKHNPLGLNKSQLLSLSLSSKEVFNLYHFDGRTWSGTRQEFLKEFGERFDFNSRRKTVSGWCKSLIDAKFYLNKRKINAKKASLSRGDICGENNPMYGVDRRISKNISLLHKNGDTYQGCSIKFADSIGMRSKDDYQRMMKTIHGKKKVKGVIVKSFKGWTRLNAI